MPNLISELSCIQERNAPFQEYGSVAELFYNISRRIKEKLENFLCVHFALRVPVPLVFCGVK
jgi:hypothetical protein